MSSGSNHDRLHRFLMMPAGISAGIITFIWSNDLVYGFELGSILYLGMQFNRLATPDSDQNNETYQDYLARTIDPYFGYFWYVFMWLYGEIIPHRSIFSHGFILGGLLRLFYMFLLLSPIIFYFGLQDYFLNDYFVLFVIGYVAGDSVHLLMDLPYFTRRFGK